MIETVWSGEVEQVAHGDERVTLHKEVMRLRGDLPLAMVRKHLPGGPTLPPVLLVHGFAQNRYSWHTSKRSMSAWLAGRGWDVWNLELRGHGRSRDAGGGGADRFDDYVHDALLASEALPAPAFWVGHSLGGAVLYAAATFLQPQRASTIGKPPRGVAGIAALFHFGRANPAMGLLTAATNALAGLPALGRFQVRTKLAGNLIARLYGLSDATGYAVPLSGWWPGSVEPELLSERLTHGFDWTSLTVWQEMSRWAAEGRFSYEEQWARTDVPLLVLLGDKDHLLPPADGRVAYDRSSSHDKTIRVFDDWHDEVHWGHLDLILGRHAPRHVWPALDAWMRARAGSGKG